MNSFHQLAFLNKEHGRLLRGVAYVVSFALVLMTSGRLALARHAARLWAADQFTQGAHVLRWHLSHGWTGQFLRRTPMFDVSATMDAHIGAIAKDQLLERVARNRNASWGHSPQRDRFALLNFLARDFQNTGELTPYLKIANLIARDLCTTPAAAIPATKPNRFTRAHAREALLSIAAMLSGISTPWYIVSGTFLGAVREGDFLSHDYDIDVGINIEDLNANHLRAAVLENPELTLVNENPYIHQTAPKCHDVRPALFRVMHSSGIEVDVFIHHLDENQRWHGSTTHRWTNSDFALGDYMIADIAIRGPLDADLYLTENYGNWRVPVTIFDCSTGTPNVSFNHNLFSVSRQLYEAARATRHSTDVAAETSRRILIQEGYLTRTKTGWKFTVPWAS